MCSRARACLCVYKNPDISKIYLEKENIQDINKDDGNKNISANTNIAALLAFVLDVAISIFAPKTAWLEITSTKRLG